jgi:general secretion pathway protein B
VSYILDALRRADSEREPGGVPGLHSQPAANAEPAARRPRRQWLAWAVAVGALGLIATLAAWLVLRAPAPGGDRVVAPAAGTATGGAVAPTPPGTDTAPVYAPVAATPDPSVPIAPPAPWPSKSPAASAAPGRTKPATKDAAAGSSPPATPSSTAAPPAAPRATPVVLRDDLPPALRNDLPPLAVGGSMYSTVPANRTLILDGRLVRENERLAPDLVLEEIRMKSAVLSFRGTRFEIRY